MRQLLSHVEERLDDPSAQGLATAVSRAVSEGVIPPGTVLPPIRTVAHQLALSPTTVSKAWRTLARAGVVRTEGRRGTRVMPSTRPSTERYGRVVDVPAGVRLDVSAGVPDADLLPSLTRALTRLPAAAVPHSYVDDPVLPELRRLLRADWPYDAHTLAITDGAMDGLDLISRTALRFGDRVAVEDPCFPTLVDLLESLGLRVVGIPMDDEGMVPAELARIAGAGLAAVYLQPRGHNPTGIAMTPRRAQALAAVCREHGLLAVEDDSMGAVSSVEPVSLGRWLPELTVHVRSFSKSHGPDLRLAAVSGPGQLMGEAMLRRQLGQGWTSRLLQQVLIDLLTDPESIAAVARARDVYAERRSLLVSALAERGVQCPGTDGLNVWIPVRDEAAALIHLAARGIGAAPGSPFAVHDLTPHIRVTSGAIRSDHSGVADQLADAARVGAWSARRR